ncbi:MAG: hypothetical protein WBG71_04375 [Leeuwenhoekiella sp.]
MATVRPFTPKQQLQAAKDKEICLKNGIKIINEPHGLSDRIVIIQKGQRKPQKGLYLKETITDGHTVVLGYVEKIARIYRNLAKKIHDKAAEKEKAEQDRRDAARKRRSAAPIAATLLAVPQEGLDLFLLLMTVLGVLAGFGLFLFLIHAIAQKYVIWELGNEHKEQLVKHKKRLKNKGMQPWPVITAAGTETTVWAINAKNARKKADKIPATLKIDQND